MDRCLLGLEHFGGLGQLAQGIAVLGGWFRGRQKLVESLLLIKGGADTFIGFGKTVSSVIQTVSLLRERQTLTAKSSDLMAQRQSMAADSARDLATAMRQELGASDCSPGRLPCILTADNGSGNSCTTLLTFLFLRLQPVTRTILQPACNVVAACRFPHQRIQVPPQPQLRWTYKRELKQSETQPVFARLPRCLLYLEKCCQSP